MWLYRHHTCSDLIDLDHESGRWRPVDESEKPPGAKVLADLPVRGSYAIVDDKRYCNYWTDDGLYVFRASDDAVFKLFRTDADGAVTSLMPGARGVIEPATHGDGRARHGLSRFRLMDGQGRLLHELVYDSAYYARLHAADVTAAAAVQDLSDWDFFVALAGGIEMLAERATSGRRPLTLDDEGFAAVDGRRIAEQDLLYADSGDLCPRAGIWACIDDLRGSMFVAKGAAMPRWQEREVRWVWSRDP